MGLDTTEIKLAWRANIESIFFSTPDKKYLADKAAIEAKQAAEAKAKQEALAKIQA